MESSRKKIRMPVPSSGGDTSAAEAVANNEDMLIEVLRRLRAKPLIKFKCVSKKWLCLISNPQFCQAHARHHNPSHTPSALLLSSLLPPARNLQIVPLKEGGGEVRVPDLDYFGVPRVEILHSCNGLLLCQSAFLVGLNEQIGRHRSYSGEVCLPIKDNCASVVTELDRGRRYFVCNPTTRQFKILAMPGCGFKNSIYAVYLAFDPSRSPHYKVICVRDLFGSKIGDYKFQIDMYLSEIESWSSTGIILNTTSLLAEHAVFCNGAIHWDRNDGRTSWYFDVDNVCLKNMPIPGFRETTLYFGASRGHLYKISSPFANLSSELKVFEMRDDYSEWFVRYRVGIGIFKQFIFPGPFWHGSKCSVLSIVGGEKEEEWSLVLFVPGMAISYNFHSGTSKKLCNVDKPDNGRSLVYDNILGFEYFEVLSCI